MSGLGRSAQEKSAISYFAQRLKGLELGDSDAVANGTRVVDDILAALRPHGIDPFKSTQGNEYATRDQFTAPRLKAGLTIADIKNHWNRPLLVILGEDKVRELVNFIVINVADQQGKDLRAAANEYNKNYPRYGDPAKWDPTDKVNTGLRDIDADLYPEFATRVDTWRGKTSDSEVSQLVERHGTLNAAIRHLVSTNAL